MPRFCTDCGSPQPSTGRFCGECGVPTGTIDPERRPGVAPVTARPLESSEDDGSLDAEWRRPALPPPGTLPLEAPDVDGTVHVPKVTHQSVSRSNRWDDKLVFAAVVTATLSAVALWAVPRVVEASQGLPDGSLTASFGVRSLLVALMLGLIPAAIAARKGASFFGWWVAGVALWIVALPAAIMFDPYVERPRTRPFFKVVGGVVALALVVGGVTAVAPVIDGSDLTFDGTTMALASLTQQREAWPAAAVSPAYSPVDDTAMPPAAPMPPPPPASPGTFGPGTWRIGEQLPPGTYQTAGPQSGFPLCYWSRLSGFSGEFTEIIANDVAYGPATVAVAPGDAAFETSGCQPWSRIP